MIRVAIPWSAFVAGFLELIVTVVVCRAEAGPLAVLSFDSSCLPPWRGAFTNGVCTPEAATGAAGQWEPRQNFFTTNSSGEVVVPPAGRNEFFRLATVDISTNAPDAFANLAS